jgi:hypothetical protein
MSISDQQDNGSAPPSRRPGVALSRRGLTLLFGLVLLCPIVIVGALAVILPAAHDRPLAVSAELVATGGKPQKLRIRNEGEFPLRAVRIELNGAFAYFPQAPLPPGEEVDLDLDWFMKKTGSHLEPGQTEIRTIHISARLPGNQRAVFEKTITSLSKS